LRSTYRN